MTLTRQSDRQEMVSPPEFITIFYIEFTVISKPTMCGFHICLNYVLYIYEFHIYYVFNLV